MNLRIVAYVMGRLLYALTIAILIPFFAALVWHEPVMNFGITFFISLFVAGICTNQGELPEDKLLLLPCPSCSERICLLQTVFLKAPQE